MRLFKYINEGTQATEIETDSLQQMGQIVKKDCSKFLRLSKGYPLFRGFSRDVGPFMDETLYKKRTRKDRRPKATDLRAYEALNKWLEKNGFARRDKSVIVTSNSKHTEIFGAFVGVVYPIGNFKYTWVESYDFNLSDIRSGWSGIDAEFSFKYNKEDEIEEWSKYIHKDNIMKAINEKYEIWFECDSYYIIDPDTYWRIGL